MRAAEFLIEGATPILFHYCSTGAALKILTTGQFQLSNVTGNKSEQMMAPPGYPYFLSLTRSKVGDYHSYTGTSACMFVVDGNWLSARYKVGPVDYWERAWNQPGGNRTRESEDRVFSKQPNIPIDGVIAAHALLKEQAEYRSSEVRNLMLLAKKRGLPVYLYTDEKAWRLQDTRRAIQPSQSGTLLRGQAPKGYTRMSTNYLGGWLELIYKNKKEDLSKVGEKLRYNVVYSDRSRRDDDSGLANDLSNARKPSSEKEYDTANKITEYMRRNKMASTVDLKNALSDKWRNIE